MYRKKSYLLVFVIIFLLSSIYVFPSLSGLSVATSTSHQKLIFFTTSTANKIILFDDAHDKPNDDDLSTNYADFKVFVESKGYSVEALTSGSITLDKLKNYTFYILNDPNIALDSAEIDAIKSYIQQGGRVLVVADSDTAYGSVNEIISIFGVNLTEIASAKMTLDSFSASHYVVKNLKNVTFGSSDFKLTVNNTLAMAIANTTTSDIGIAAFDKIGKLVVLADADPLININSDTNYTTLVSNILDWLSKPVLEVSFVNPPTYIVQGATVSIDLVLNNTGQNTLDSSDISILTPADASVTQPSYTISSFSSKSITVDLTIDDFAETVTKNITFAFSWSGGIIGNSSFETKILPAIIVSNVDIEGYTVQGQAFNITCQIENNGTKTYSYTIMINGSSIINVSHTESLLAGNTVTKHIRVEIPNDADAGKSEVNFTVMRGSHVIYTKVFEITILEDFIIISSTPEDSSLAQGDSTQLTLHIINNRTEEVDVTIRIYGDAFIEQTYNVTLKPGDNSINVYLNASDFAPTGSQVYYIDIIELKNVVESRYGSIIVKPAVDVLVAIPNQVGYPGENLSVQLTLTNNRKSTFEEVNITLSGSAFVFTSYIVQLNYLGSPPNPIILNATVSEIVEPGEYELNVTVYRKGHKIHSSMYDITVESPVVLNTESLSQIEIYQSTKSEVTLVFENKKSKPITVSITTSGNNFKAHTIQATLQPGENEINVPFEYNPVSPYDTGSRQAIIEVEYNGIIVYSQTITVIVKMSVTNMVIGYGLPPIIVVGVLATMFMLFRKKKKLLQDIIRTVNVKKSVSVDEIASEFNISPKKAREILIKLEEEELVNGFFDDNVDRFVVLDKTLVNSIINEIKNKGEINIQKYSQERGISETYIKDIISAAVDKGILVGRYLDNGNIFILTEYMRNKIKDIITKAGWIRISEVSQETKIPEDIIRSIIDELLSAGEINGIISGDTFATMERLSDEIIKVIQRRDKITLKEITNLFGISENLAYTLLRRAETAGFLVLITDTMTGDMVAFNKGIWDAILKELSKNGVIHVQAFATMQGISFYLAKNLIDTLVRRENILGVWTADNSKFITADAIYDRIKDSLNEEVGVGDLARKVNLPVETMKRLLEVMIRQGIIRGALVDAGKTFVPITMLKRERFAPTVVGEEAPAAPVATAVKLPQVDVDYEYSGGQIIYHIGIRNFTDLVITDVTVNLDVPKSLKLVRIDPKDYAQNIKEGISKIPDISPMDFAAVDYYFEPVSCGKTIVSGIVNYKDAKGAWKSVTIEGREVEIPCPEIFTPEEANMATLKNLMKAIRLNDYRRFVLTINPKEAFEMLRSVINSYNVREISINVISEQPFESEGWFYARIGPRKDRVVIRTYVNEATKIIDINVACDDPMELSGLLGRISDDFSRRLFLKEQKEAIAVSGNFKILQCTCGAPLPKLPTKDEPVKCEFCGTVWYYDDLK